MLKIHIYLLHFYTSWVTKNKAKDGVQTPTWSGTFDRNDIRIFLHTADGVVNTTTTTTTTTTTGMDRNLWPLMIMSTALYAFLGTTYTNCAYPNLSFYCILVKFFLYLCLFCIYFVLSTIYGELKAWLIDWLIYILWVCNIRPDHLQCS